jgi:hypothetical protein
VLDALRHSCDAATNTATPDQVSAGETALRDVRDAAVPVGTTGQVADLVLRAAAVVLHASRFGPDSDLAEWIMPIALAAARA